MEGLGGAAVWFSARRAGYFRQPEYNFTVLNSNF